MVDYQNPEVISREFSAYAFLSCFRGLRPGLPIGLFDSGAPEALARCKWYIYVSLSVLPR